MLWREAGRKVLTRASHGVSGRSGNTRECGGQCSFGLRVGPAAGSRRISATRSPRHRLRAGPPSVPCARPSGKRETKGKRARSTMCCRYRMIKLRQCNTRCWVDCVAQNASALCGGTATKPCGTSATNHCTGAIEETVVRRRKIRPCCPHRFASLTGRANLGSSAACLSAKRA